MRNLIHCLWLLMPFGAFAQTPQPWEFGLGIGTSTHYGETNTIQMDQAVFGFNPAASLHFRKNLHNRFSLRANLFYAGLSGNDQHYKTESWRQIRGLAFSGSLVEFAAMAEYYPWGMYPKRSRNSEKLSPNRRSVCPYVTLGIGTIMVSRKVFWNDPQTNEYLDPTLVQVDKNQPLKPDISMPLGFGIRIRTNKHITLGIEALVSPTLSDYLDGISVAGDPASNDWFLSAQLNASYAFGKDPKRSKGGTKKSKDEADELPDSDGDQVPDERDECPEIVGFRYLKGCPDLDRDGIPDKTDLCPEIAGLPTLNGCPDRDEDGVPDKDDHCPELKGVASFHGCPAIDRDKDGVADADDLCPDMSGQAKWKGCPDSDNDGLPDNKDGCPGIAGPQNLRGCPDSDLDGISDKEDECPTIAGILAKKGCPEAPAPNLGVPYKAVYFGSTLQDWHTTSITTLDEIVVYLQSDASIFARLEGHTDDTGKEPANDLLSEKRAKKCLDYLVSKGIDAARLNYLGFGSARPTVPNDTRSNRQLNRRVEVHFYKKSS